MAFVRSCRLYATGAKKTASVGGCRDVVLCVCLEFVHHFDHFAVGFEREGLYFGLFAPEEESFHSGDACLVGHFALQVADLVFPAYIGWYEMMSHSKKADDGLYSPRGTCGMSGKRLGA